MTAKTPQEELNEQVMKALGFVMNPGTNVIPPFLEHDYRKNISIENQLENVVALIQTRDDYWEAEATRQKEALLDKFDTMAHNHYEEGNRHRKYIADFTAAERQALSKKEEE